MTALPEKQQHDHLLGRVASHLLSRELGDKTEKSAEHNLFDDRDPLWYAADELMAQLSPPQRSHAPSYRKF